VAMAGEFGLTSRQGERLTSLLCSSASTPMTNLPALARELFAAQAEGNMRNCKAQIDEVDARLMAWHRAR